LKKNFEPFYSSILFVCSDPSQRVIIKTVASTRFSIFYCVTRETIPLNFKSYDLLILPASLVLLDEELITQCRVIAHGPIELMPKAFLQGCVDYLAEPWYPEELFYRALRFQTPQRILFEGSEFLILPHGIQTKDRTIPLTAIEFSLLLTLLKAKGSIVPRAVLEQLIPGPSLGPFSRRIDAHMARLRKKIRSCSGSNDSLIRSARGSGYYLVTD